VGGSVAVKTGVSASFSAGAAVLLSGVDGSVNISAASGRALNKIAGGNVTISSGNR